MADNNTSDLTGKKHNSNLWKKGQSGNPNGRPKGTVSVVSKIKSKLKKIPPGQKHSYLTMLVERIFKKAIQDGDEQMLKLIVQYVDGMPKQSTDLNIRELPKPLLNDVHNNDSSKEAGQTNQED